MYSITSLKRHIETRWSIEKSLVV